MTTKMTKSIQFLARRSLLLLLVFLLSLLTTVELVAEVSQDAPQSHPAPTADPLKGNDWIQVAEAGEWSLSVIPATAEIKVSHAECDWYSNPQKREEDPIATGLNLQRLGAQAIVIYYTPAGLRMEMDTVMDSVRFEQQSVFPLESEDGILVRYILGEQPKDYLHPQAMTQERYAEISELAGSKGERILKRRYSEYSWDKLKDDEKESYGESYPLIKEEPIYILRDNIKDFVLEEISEMFADIGYTYEDRDADEAAVGVQVEADEALTIELGIEYRLREGALDVRIPYEELSYDPDYPVTQVRLLPYFAAGSSDDEGYLMVPDGSGALINFNNGKVSADAYNDRCYGIDAALQNEVQVGVPEQIALPVFGIKQNEQAFLCRIEEGSAISSIRADIAGKTDDYNSVYPVYNVLARDEVDLHELSGNNIILAFQQERYPGDYRLCYTFLEGDDANYSGMARTYREQLLAEGVLEQVASNDGTSEDAKTSEDAEALPLQLEVLGAIDKRQAVVGIPVTRTIALTTYQQLAEILEDLSSQGVEAMDVRYSGWQAGGRRQNSPANAKLAKVLGKEEDFRNLLEVAKQTKADLYPETSPLYAFKNRLFDGNLASRDFARFLNRKMVELSTFRPSDMTPDNEAPDYWLLAPESMSAKSNKFRKDYAHYGHPFLSLRDIGQDLAADYNIKREVDRESAMQQSQEILEAYQAAGYHLAAQYGNQYVLPYVEVLSEVPLSSSRYQIIDESIPFIQMVLHGSIAYAGTAINKDYQGRADLLQLIEYGASPAYRLMAADNSVLKDSQYNRFYSIQYADWRENILDVYEEINPVLGPLQGESMVEHEIIDHALRRVTYSDGTQIILNYSDEAASYDGETIPALDYRVTTSLLGKEQGGNDE